MIEQKLITELGLFRIMITRLSKIERHAPQHVERLLASYPAVVEQVLGAVHEQLQHGLGHAAARRLVATGRDVMRTRLDADGCLDRGQLVAGNVVILQSSMQQCQPVTQTNGYHFY